MWREFFFKTRAALVLAAVPVPASVYNRQFACLATCFGFNGTGTFRELGPFLGGPGVSAGSAWLELSDLLKFCS